MICASHALQTKTNDNVSKKNTPKYAQKISFWQTLGANSKKGTAYKELLHYMNSPYAKQRHITPAVKECIDNCVQCEYDSCVEYISPEQVFENLKKILFPC